MFCRMECSRSSWRVCFRHVCRWKMYILIILGDVLFENDEKIRIKMTDSLFLYVSTQCDAVCLSLGSRG